MRLAVSLLLLMDLAQAAQVELSRTELCEYAERIVVGEVTDVQTLPTPDDRIERLVHLAVSQTVKGERTDDVTVTVPGGTLGEVTLWVEHAPVLLTDATYLLFIAPDGSVVAGEQGAIRITAPKALKGETLDEALRSVEACRAN